MASASPIILPTGGVITPLDLTPWRDNPALRSNPVELPDLPAGVDLDALRTGADAAYLSTADRAALRDEYHVRRHGYVPVYGPDGYDQFGFSPEGYDTKGMDYDGYTRKDAADLERDPFLDEAPSLPFALQSRRDDDPELVLDGDTDKTHPRPKNFGAIAADPIDPDNSDPDIRRRWTKQGTTDRRKGNPGNRGNAWGGHGQERGTAVDGSGRTTWQCWRDLFVANETAGPAAKKDDAQIAVIMSALFPVITPAYDAADVTRQRLGYNAAAPPVISFRYLRTDNATGGLTVIRYSGRRPVHVWHDAARPAAAHWTDAGRDSTPQALTTVPPPESDAGPSALG